MSIMGRKIVFLSGLLILMALAACQKEPDPAVVEAQGTLSALNAITLAQGTQIAELSRLELDNRVAVSRVQTNLEALATQSAAQSTAMAEQNTRLAADIREQGTLISYLATRGPAPATMNPNSTPTPYRPVLGSVVLNEGACCVSGAAGAIIELEAAFEAESPPGEVVTELRARLGTIPFSELELEDDEWQPYVEAINFPVEVAVNWTSYHVSAQFRDAAGNLSPVYHDEIAVEGLP
jgi:hypothetical protein